MKIEAYHTSKSNNLQKIDLSKATRGDYGVGLYLSSTKEGAYGYGSHLYKVDLDLSNPYIVDDSPESLALAQKMEKLSGFGEREYESDVHPFVELCTMLNMSGETSLINKVVVKSGFDSLIVTQKILSQVGTQTNGDYIVAFNPEQIVNIEKASGSIDLEPLVLDILKRRPLSQRELWHELIDRKALNSLSTADSFALIDLLNRLQTTGKVVKDFDLLKVKE